MNSWFERCIFYHIYTLGFCGVLDKVKDKKNEFKQIESLIKKFKDLNINAIYFGPVFESVFHGYDTKDYFVIDKRLGSNDDFKNLCLKLHDNNIKIVLDGVFNHVSREFFAFKDIKKNGRNSKYVNWFYGLNFNSKSPMKDDFNYTSWNGHYELVKLNLKNEEVINYLFSAIKEWIDEFDIDGLRLDAADCIDFEFFKRLKKYTETLKKDFYLMGEIIHGDYSRYVNSEMLNSVTNYECYKGIYSSHNDKNYFEIAYSLNRMYGNYGIYKGLYLYNFVDNHDVNRVSSTLKNEEYIYNVYTLLYTMPGVPSIYYGSEYGIKGIKEQNSDLPLRPDIESINRNEKNIKLYNHIKKLGKLRLNSTALMYGEYEQVLIRNEQYVFSRKSKNEKVYVLLNLSNKESYVDFNISFNKAYNLLDETEEIINGGKVRILIPPFSSKILGEVKEKNN